MNMFLDVLGVLGYVIYGILILTPIINALLLLRGRKKYPALLYIIDLVAFFTGVYVILGEFYGMGYLGNEVVQEFTLPVSPTYYPVLVAFLAVAIISFLVLAIGKGKIPLKLALMLSGGVMLGILIATLWCIQISCNINNEYVSEEVRWMFSSPLILIFCSVRLLLDTTVCYADKLKTQTHAENFFTKKSTDPKGFLTLSLAAAAVIFLISIPITISFGFPANGLIKAFTHTALWTFSKGFN